MQTVLSRSASGAQRKTALFQAYEKSKLDLFYFLKLRRNVMVRHSDRKFTIKLSILSVEFVVSLFFVAFLWTAKIRSTFCLSATPYFYGKGLYETGKMEKFGRENGQMATLVLMITLSISILFKADAPKNFRPLSPLFNFYLKAFPS